MENLNNNYVNVKECEFRNTVQNDFDKAIFKNDYGELREIYKRIRNFEFDNYNYKKHTNIDLGNLSESLSYACDVIATETGINFIYCGDNVPKIWGDIYLITKAILNLMSNAYLYGNNNLVTVKTFADDYYVKICITSGGTINYKKDGRGLLFVRNVCKMHEGKFFILTKNGTTSAYMMIPSISAKSEIVKSTDCLSFLNDKLSPIYIEFFGMEYH